jgi:hypothetical protein
MKKLLLAVTGLMVLCTSAALADPATEAAIKKHIMDNNAYSTRELKSRGGQVSKEGSLEFWSSGGLLHEVPPNDEIEEFDAFTIKAKHIHVVTLVPGKAAVAMYYSEGGIDRKNSAAVPNYRTRVTQVFVNEDGEWKVRAAHWSPIAGGSGTSQTSVED